VIPVNDFYLVFSPHALLIAVLKPDHQSILCDFAAFVGKDVSPAAGKISG
jgi:hypothetical protein